MLPPLTNLEDLITQKAHAQALAEWGQLENLIDQWFKDHPAKYSRLKRNDAEHYGAHPPLMRLDSFPSNHPELKIGLQQFAANFVEDRTAAVGRQIAQELLTKTALLP